MFGRLFNVTAKVKNGAAEAERNLAVSLGMEKALPLPDLNAVSLRGTIEQILVFAADNPGLIEIFEFAPVDFIDPVIEPEINDLVGKDINLGDLVEEITSVSTTHNLNFKGAGTAIAVIDSGIWKDHEQFKGRVIAEACMALEDDSSYQPVCEEGSSAPAKSQEPFLHNHGFHVTGIAAGRDGIAPDAKIVSINVSVEDCSGSSCVESNYWSPYEVAQYLADLQRAYKQAGSPQIIAVNMSLGIDKYAAACDDDLPFYHDVFDLMTANDMIPVAAAGNQGYFDFIGAPACISSVFSVGALKDSSGLFIAEYSNHSEMIDILAPGSHIYSALYQSSGCSRPQSCYGDMSGTSGFRCLCNFEAGTPGNDQFYASG